MYTFVSGGFRSGRSNYALRKAADLGPPPWNYVTAVMEEDAIRKRIERHQKGKDAFWHVQQMPDDLRPLLAPESVSQYGSVVLDGIAVWIEKWLKGREADADEDLLKEIEEISYLMHRAPRPIVMVTREVGLARLPDRDDEQRIVRITTSANQILARNASRVMFMVSGIAMRVR